MEFVCIGMGFPGFQEKRVPGNMSGTLFLGNTYGVERLLLKKHRQVDGPAFYVDRGNDWSALG